MNKHSNFCANKLRSEKGVRKNPQENFRLYMHKINQPVTSTDGKEIKDVK